MIVFRSILLIFTTAIWFTFLLTSAAMAGSCFDEFSSNICLKNQDQSLSCGRGDVAVIGYIDKLEHVFDLTPPSVQKLFCSLKAIHIVERTGPASGRYYRPIETVELMKDLFGSSAKSAAVVTSSSLTNKYSFGLEFMNLEQDDSLRLIFKMLLHELGHHFQQHIFADPLSCPRYRNEPQGTENKWVQAVRAWRFQKEHPIADADKQDYFHWLERSPFVSTYSIMNRNEEYAESFLHYVAATYLGMRVQTFDGEKMLFDSKSEAFVTAKREGQNIIGKLLDAYYEGDIGARFDLLNCGQ